MIAPSPAPPPRLLFWETTSRCNLACVHCRRLDVAEALAANDLTTAQALTLIDQIAAMGKPVLVLSGGEPLSRPDIFLLARRAWDLDIPVALASNGTLIDAPMARRIRAAGIRRVAVSLDGADAATHDGFRGQAGSWAQALAGIAAVRAEGVEVQINATIARHNFGQEQAIYDLAESCGAAALHLFMLVPVGCGAQIKESHTLTPGEMERILRWLTERARAGPLQVRATCAPQYYRILEQQGVKPAERPDPSGLHGHTKGCLAGTGVGFISHTGEVFPCGYLPLSAGNVTETPLPDLWQQAPLLQSLRRPQDLEGKCGDCEFAARCGGCRARAYFATGNYLAEEPQCPYTPAVRRERTTA